MAQRTASSQAILIIGLELLGVAIFTMIAGINDRVGNIMVVLMAGLMMAWALSGSGAFKLNVAVGDLWTLGFVNPSNKK